MKISNFKQNEDICGIFQLEWYCVWVFEKTLYLPTLDELKRMMEETHSEDRQYIPHLYDCDKSSLALLAAQQLWVVDNKFQVPWAFYRVWGTRCRGRIINHHWNMAYTQDGIYFCESMDYVDRIWKFEDLDRDKIEFAHI